MAHRVKVTWGGVVVPGGGLSTFNFTGLAGTEQDCADAVSTFMTTIQSYLNQNVTWRVENDVEEFDVVTGALTGVTTVTGSNGVGLKTEEALPWATQGLLRLQTGFYTAGRQLRGRLFIPGFTEDESPGGTVSGTIAAGVTAAGNALVTEAVGWAVWSRTHGVQAPISVTSMWDLWAVLRSRRE